EDAEEPEPEDIGDERVAEDGASAGEEACGVCEETKPRPHPREPPRRHGRHRVDAHRRLRSMAAAAASRARPFHAERERCEFRCTMPAPTTDLALDEIRLGDEDLWHRRDRDGIFAKLRAERPVSFHAEPFFAGLPQGPGFWALTRYADVVRASCDAET